MSLPGRSCMLRYEPEFHCGKVCKRHNTGEEFTKELDTFGYSYIPESGVHRAYGALEAARRG